MARKSKYGRALTDAERADNAAFRARYEASTSIHERIAILKARGKSLRLRRKVGDFESHVESLGAKAGAAPAGSPPTPATTAPGVSAPDWRIDEFISDIETALEVNMVSAGAVLATRMKAAVSTPGPPRSTPGEPPHVDTGALLASIDSEADGLTVLVGAAVPYALDLEFGSGNVAPRPFLQSTLDDNARDIADIILTDLL